MGQTLAATPFSRERLKSVDAAAWLSGLGVTVYSQGLLALATLEDWQNELGIGGGGGGDSGWRASNGTSSPVYGQTIRAGATVIIAGQDAVETNVINLEQKWHTADATRIWYQWISRNVNPGTTGELNPVFVEGWNLAAGVAKVNTSLPAAVGRSIEFNWNPAGTERYIEAHQLVALLGSGAGTLVRPDTWLIGTNAGTAKVDRHDLVAQNHYFFVYDNANAVDAANYILQMVKDSTNWFGGTMTIAKASSTEISFTATGGVNQFNLSATVLTGPGFYSDATDFVVSRVFNSNAGAVLSGDAFGQGRAIVSGRATGNTPLISVRDRASNHNSGFSATGNVLVGDGVEANTLARDLFFETGTDTLKVKVPSGAVRIPVMDSALGTGVATQLARAANGTVSDAIGFRSVPQRSLSTDYTIVADDNGRHLYHPSADTTDRTWTIPSNASLALPIGFAFTIVNDSSAGSITLAITSDTLVLAGAGTTGSRTIAANGVVTVIKITSTRWMVTGTGVT